VLHSCCTTTRSSAEDDGWSPRQCGEDGLVQPYAAWQGCGKYAVRLRTERAHSSYIRAGRTRCCYLPDQRIHNPPIAFGAEALQERPWPRGQ
jgi:hypothetical protein